MTALNWQRDKARHEQQELRAEARYNEVRQHEQRIQSKQQQQLVAFARAHAHENSFCRQVVEQGWASRAQAGVLRRIAEEHRWPIQPVAGGKGSRSSRQRHRRRDEERRDPAVKAELVHARRIVDEYTGSDGWILYLRREFSSADERWLPTAKQATAILEKVGLPVSQ